MHDSAHPHSHEPEHKSGDHKEKLIIGYMLEHNRQHTAELIELANRVERAADAATAALIREAAKNYEAGDEKLYTALRNL